MNPKADAVLVRCARLLPFIVFLACAIYAVADVDPNIAAAATKLNTLTPQAVPKQTIVVGSYDGSIGKLGSSLRQVYPSGLPGYKQSAQGGPAQPYSEADINSYNVTYQIHLSKVPAGFKLTLSTPNAQGTMVDVPATLDNTARLASISFHPYSGAIQLLKAYDGNVEKSVLYIVPLLRPQLGAFVVPHLLLAIVYEPPGSRSDASYSTTSTLGTTFSWDFVRSSGVIQAADSSTFLSTISQVASGAGGVVTENSVRAENAEVPSIREILVRSR
jgi:hypothetical protein